MWLHSCAGLGDRSDTVRIADLMHPLHRGAVLRWRLALLDALDAEHTVSASGGW